jgi:N-acyl-D-aspartate/D-glutamate deacylase
VALDELDGAHGKGLLMLPFENYAYGSLDVVHEMITDPATVLGVADGGAHVGVICDASSPTSLLTLWGRDRSADRSCARVPGRQADARHGGGLRPARPRPAGAGHKADINVIDFDALALKRPRWSTTCRPAAAA